MTTGHEARFSLGRFDLARRAGREKGALLAFKTAELTLRALQDYHRHSVVGMENIPRTGPALVLFNHSVAVYDSLLPVVTVFDRDDRVMWGVADRLIFRTPGLGAFFRGTGFSEGTREELVSLLGRGEMIGLAPGGMREALRVARKKYEVDWNDRLGFVRVSVLSGAPIILAACPRGDDIYVVYDSPLKDWVYRKFKVPLPTIRGLGPTLVPQPVKLTHLISEPILPPPGRERVSQEELHAHHRRIVDRMGVLMRDALALDGRIEPAHGA